MLSGNFDDLFPIRVKLWHILTNFTICVELINQETSREWRWTRLFWPKPWLWTYIWVSGKSNKHVQCVQVMFQLSIKDLNFYKKHFTFNVYCDNLNPIRFNGGLCSPTEITKSLSMLLRNSVSKRLEFKLFTITLYLRHILAKSVHSRQSTSRYCEGLGPFPL